MKVFLTLISLFITLSLDQVTKAFVSSFTLSTPTITILPFFNFVHVWNNGVAFGIMESIPFARVILSILVFVVVANLLYVLSKEIITEDNLLKSFSLSMIVSGGFGNLIDRIRFGAVFDFIDLHAYGFHWPAFNLADFFVVCGIFFLFLDWFFYYEKK